METNHNNQTKKVVMPDGSTIDVIYGPEQDALVPVSNADVAHDYAQKLTDLSVCFSCGCDMVYPIDWEPAADRNWAVSLRCPNCEAISNGTFSEELIERFDNVLDRGTDSLVRDLCCLTHANMAEEIDKFVCALDAGAILPEDF